MAVTIYHNPRCSKSRATLELLQSANVETRVVEYLKTPPTADTVQALAKALDMPLAELVRTSDAARLELDTDACESATELAALILSNPQILQRPIVIDDKGRAVIGRPPENVNELL